jgi:hypothetical protein
MAEENENEVGVAIVGLLRAVDELNALPKRKRKRRKRLIQRVAIRRMERSGLVTATQADELEVMGWQDFLEWIMENGPEIIEFIMGIIALFSL